VGAQRPARRPGDEPAGPGALADPRRPANTTRFVYLQSEAAKEFFVDYDRIAKDAAMLRLEAGRNPHEALIELVGELSTRSELFRTRWTSHDVQFHRSGRKRLRHPTVGQLDLDFESLELSSAPGLQLNVYTAAGTPTADALSSVTHRCESRRRVRGCRALAPAAGIRYAEGRPERNADDQSPATASGGPARGRGGGLDRGGVAAA
jgi:hypothetical protein